MFRQRKFLFYMVSESTFLSVCIPAEDTWKNRCWKITQSFSAAVFSGFLLSHCEFHCTFFSGCSCKIGKAAALRHLLASIYLCAHPRGHLIALQCTANTWSVSTGYKAALLTAAVPEVYLATGFNLRPLLPLHLRSTLVHYYSKEA